MPSDPVTQEHSSNFTIEDLDRRLVRALEAAPQTKVSADFAARLVASLPAPAPISITIRATHYGRSAILIGIIIVLAAMLTLAAYSMNHSTLDILLEWILFAQFVALTIWFSTWCHSAN